MTALVVYDPTFAVRQGAPVEDVLYVHWLRSPNGRYQAALGPGKTSLNYALLTGRNLFDDVLDALET